MPYRYDHDYERKLRIQNRRLKAQLQSEQESDALARIREFVGECGCLDASGDRLCNDCRDVALDTITEYLLEERDD